MGGSADGKSGITTEPSVGAAARARLCARRPQSSSTTRARSAPRVILQEIAAEASDRHAVIISPFRLKPRPERAPPPFSPAESIDCQRARTVRRVNGLSGTARLDVHIMNGVYLVVKRLRLNRRRILPEAEEVQGESVSLSNQQFPLIPGAFPGSLASWGAGNGAFPGRWVTLPPGNA